MAICRINDELAESNCQRDSYISANTKENDELVMLNRRRNSYIWAFISENDELEAANRPPAWFIWFLQYILANMDAHTTVMSPDTTIARLLIDPSISPISIAFAVPIA